MNVIQVFNFIYETNKIRKNYRCEYKCRFVVYMWERLGTVYIIIASCSTFEEIDLCGKTLAPLT